MSSWEIIKDGQGRSYLFIIESILYAYLHLVLTIGSVLIYPWIYFLRNHQVFNTLICSENFFSESTWVGWKDLDCELRFMELLEDSWLNSME